MNIRKKVFLSHIHEEKDLAILIQGAIEDEFSGFVDVFVSSDGRSILAGTNFLKRIEEMLLNASGAIFLISHRSVKRNWINFELGAIWIRGVNDVVIPAIPFCHSGITPKNLPPPLNSLNAIQANDENQLEKAFYSLQRAFGVNGKLKTDFSALSEKIKDIERKNILCSRLARIISIFVGKKFFELLPEWENLANGSTVEVRKSGIGNSIIGELEILKKSSPEIDIDYDLSNIREVSDTDGNTYSSDICLKMPVDIFISNKTELSNYEY
ncbi:MAG: toll/interleukin-1 receptor domain-containing protein [Deltaproteobacteria bacterium]|nr:toll/interleukin-1 receptor domain-containing protein [Deltaproteobacteria bacterium]